MKIKTHLFDIEITPKGYFEEGTDESEAIKMGSEIVKLLLDKISMKSIKIEYSEDEKNA